MGLSGWFRGWFDPIVEFMRPVPPLALIPLVIIWFGIGEQGKIILLFLSITLDYDYFGKSRCFWCENFKNTCRLLLGRIKVADYEISYCS